MAELLTTLTMQSASASVLTTADLLTVAQVNASPQRQISSFLLNSNVLEKSLTATISTSLAGGPAATFYTELPTTGLVLPSSSATVLWLIRGLAVVVVAGSLLMALPANSPTNAVRQTYASLFSVGTSDLLNLGVLLRRYYLTAIVSPAKTGNTWTWPAYNSSVQIFGEMTTEDTAIYPYVK